MNVNTLLRAVACGCLVLLAAACGGGGGSGTSAASPAAPTGFAQRSMTAITSVQTGATYNVQIYLPAAYAQGTARYPVIYAADAESRFTILADILEREGRPIILVNIWNMGAARRWADFTMPGAQAYYRFLTQELVPAIDAQYRTDPARRTYNGHSLTGMFTLYALYMERPAQRYFSSFISEEGSFWYDSDMRVQNVLDFATAADMERQMYARDTNLPVTLVMAGDALANGPLVTTLYNYLSTRGYQNLRITLRTYQYGHVGMDPLAFDDAVALIFGPP